MKTKQTLKELVVDHFGSVQNCATEMKVSTPTMYTYMKYPSNMQIGFFVNLAKELKLTKDELFKIVNS
jgi:hypothetical protein